MCSALQHAVDQRNSLPENVYGKNCTGSVSSETNWRGKSMIVNSLIALNYYTSDSKLHVVCIWESTTWCRPACSVFWCAFPWRRQDIGVNKHWIWPSEALLFLGEIGSASKIMLTVCIWSIEECVVQGKKCVVEENTSLFGMSWFGFGLVVTTKAVDLKECEGSGYLHVTRNILWVVKGFCICFVFSHITVIKTLPLSALQTQMLQETVDMRGTFNCICPLYLRNQKENSGSLMINLLLVFFWRTAVQFSSWG